MANIQLKYMNREILRDIFEGDKYNAMIRKCKMQNKMKNIAGDKIIIRPVNTFKLFQSQKVTKKVDTS